jgi:hypothetical protein
MKHHYVYHSYEEWGREYIGIRSCNCLPEEDIKYFGSFKDKTFNPTEKTILFVRETREEVAEIEIILHDFFNVAVNPKFSNQAKQTSTGFDRTGVPRTEAQNKARSGEKSPGYGRTGEKHPNYGRTGASHPQSKAIIVIEPDGTQRHYGGVCEAARDLKIDHSILCYYLKIGHVLKCGKLKGWRFLYKNSENF